MEIRTFDQIYRDMKTRIIAANDRLADFNDGSVLMSLVEAQAREFALLYINCQAGFAGFMRSLPQSVFDFGMKRGERASARVVFSRERPLGRETRIPAGESVSGGGREFATVEPCAIDAITSAVPPDVAKVANPRAAAGGADGEDWPAYLRRFSQYITGLSGTNFNGYTSALTAKIARSVSIVEHFPPLGGLRNMTVYLEDGSGGMTEEGFENARRAGDASRPPGVNIRYLAPEVLKADITVKAVLRDSREHRGAAAAALEAAALAYADGLRIGEPLILSGLTVALKAAGVAESVVIGSPASDIRPGRGQIVRAGGFAVSFGG